MTGNSVALPRSRARRRRIRPPGAHWWRAMTMVSLAFLSIALRVISGDLNIEVGVSAAAQVFVVFVYWPDLKSPYRPYRSPADPVHVHVIAALLASAAFSLLMPY